MKMKKYELRLLAGGRWFAFTFESDADFEKLTGKEVAVIEKKFKEFALLLNSGADESVKYQIKKGFLYLDGVAFESRAMFDWERWEAWKRRYYPSGV